MAKKSIMIASNNAKKIKELKAILPQDWDLHTLPRDGSIDWVEDGSTFRDNALIKAKAVEKIWDGMILADDSGLEVLALGNRPGVYSSRYAGEDASDQENNEKLLKDLTDTEQKHRSARFVCCLCFKNHLNEFFFFEGFCEGTIRQTPVGSNGFGYDPIFAPDLFPKKSMAELSPEQKNTISHRGKALSSFSQFIKDSFTVD